MFTGWLAIRESWITIFRNTEMIKFIITNTKVRVFDNIAVAVCLENIETLVNGEIVRLGVIATNIFEQMENQWLLIHHHGSSVSNYIPRSVCVYYFFLIVDYDLYGTCCDHIHSTFRSNNCLTRLKEGVKVVQAL